MQPTFKLFLVLLLGGWLGASVFFSFIAAPVIFQLSKSQVISKEQAGDLASAMLKRYFVCALVVFVAALVLSGLLAFGTAQPRFVRCAVIVSIALLLIAFDGFVWGPKVHTLREERRANPSAEMDRKFGRAHALSFGLNGLVIIANAVAFFAVARPE